MTPRDERTVEFALLFLAAAIEARLRELGQTEIPAGPPAQPAENGPARPVAVAGKGDGPDGREGTTHSPRPTPAAGGAAGPDAFEWTVHRDRQLFETVCRNPSGFNDLCDDLQVSPRVARARINELTERGRLSKSVVLTRLRKEAA